MWLSYVVPYRFFGRVRSVEDDVKEHRAWTGGRTGNPLSDASIADLQHMLSQRGILQAPTYDDEPDLSSKALKGGGGRTRLMAPQTKQASRATAVRATAEDENAGHGKGTDDERLGHWISIVPPTEHLRGGPIAALLCDSLFTVPFALTAEELHDFFRVMGDLHTAAALEPHVGEAERIDLAAQWSAYSVRWDEPRISSAVSQPSTWAGPRSIIQGIPNGLTDGNEAPTV